MSDPNDAQLHNVIRSLVSAFSSLVLNHLARRAQRECCMFLSPQNVQRQTEIAVTGWLIEQYSPGGQMEKYRAAVDAGETMRANTIAIRAAEQIADDLYPHALKIRAAEPTNN